MIFGFSIRFNCFPKHSKTFASSVTSLLVLYTKSLSKAALAIESADELIPSISRASTSYGLRNSVTGPEYLRYLERKGLNIHDWTVGHIVLSLERWFWIDFFASVVTYSEKGHELSLQSLVYFSHPHCRSENGWWCSGKCRFLRKLTVFQVYARFGPLHCS